MDGIRIIELKESIFADNDAKADELRSKLKKNGCFLLNVMSSPGSGKTTTLIKLINALKNEYEIAVMEADIDGDVDTDEVIRQTGVKAVQLHTGGMCHLDAGMTETGLKGLFEGSSEEGSGKIPDLVFLENVGNLVCPAEFDTGASRSMVILSVPEGDDKPIKYPLMFEKADIAVVNKIDVLPYFDFDIEKFKKNLRERNPNGKPVLISAKNGDGIEALVSLIREEVEAWKAEN